MRTTIALAATAALIGGATLAVTAHGQFQPPQMITLQGGPANQRDIKQIDVKPRGASVGDRFLVAETLRRDGKPIGRMLTDCSAVDASYEGRMCSIALVTRDGQITAHGGGVDRRRPAAAATPKPQTSSPSPAASARTPGRPECCACARRGRATHSRSRSAPAPERETPDAQTAASPGSGAREQRYSGRLRYWSTASTRRWSSGAVRSSSLSKMWVT